MSSQNDIVSEEDIHAYVDGQLDVTQRARIEKCMESDVALRETIEHYQNQNRLLHQLYDPLLEEEVPQTLRLGRSSSQVRMGWNLAAGIALFVCGGLMGWQLKPVQQQAPTLAEVLAVPGTMAHVVYSPEVKHPVEVGAAQQEHLVHWLSKRLDKTIATPDLANFGYTLMGGRLLPGQQGPAAQFMYEDKQGERMTLYIRRKQDDEQNTAFRFYRDQHTNAFYWIDGDLGYVLSGDASRQQLQQVANSVYHQLTMP